MLENIQKTFVKLLDGTPEDACPKMLMRCFYMRVTHELKDGLSRLDQFEQLGDLWDNELKDQAVSNAVVPLMVGGFSAFCLAAMSLLLLESKREESGRSRPA
jgi:hypothetical protein